MVAGPTVTYFPVPGRGEIARLAFTVGKINFVVSIVPLYFAKFSRQYVARHNIGAEICRTHAAVDSIVGLASAGLNVEYPANCIMILSRFVGQARDSRGMGSPERPDTLRSDSSAGSGRPPCCSEWRHW